MKKILSLFLVLIIFSSISIGLTEEEKMLIQKNYEEALNEYNLSDKSIIHKSSLDKEDSKFFYVIFKDGSTLVVSTDEYSYSKIEGDEMTIKSNIKGKKDEKTLDTRELKNHLNDNKSFSDGGVNTDSIIYKDQNNNFKRFLESNYGAIFASKLTSLFIPIGFN